MKSRTTDNPFPDIRVSEAERRQLLDLVDFYVDDYAKKYENFIKIDKRSVHKRRWQHVKTKDNLHVYAERSQTQLNRRGAALEKPLNTTQRLNAETTANDLSALLGVGTLAGELEDLMFGVLNPTLDSMTVKSSYVQEFANAAMLASVVETSKQDPFRSLVIKWMSIDVPLNSTNLVKSRDFVFIEATGILNFANGDRIGYHFLHSIDFPQTKPLPNKIRGNLSVFSCFAQIERNSIDNYSCATVDPGGDVIRFFLNAKVANFLLAATNYVYCGQRKKLAWLLQHRRSAFGYQEMKRYRKQCVVCKKNTSHAIGSIGRSTCRLCCGDVCYSCKIHQRLSFIAWGGRLIQRKIVFCAVCVGTATELDAYEPATDQATRYDAFTTLSTFTFLDTSTSSLHG